MDVMQKAAEIGIVPVINIPKVELAKPLAEALLKGGINLIEVTLRNETSLESIRAIKEAYPQMCIMAGTVLSPEQGQAALDAGAEGIVTPGYDEEIVDFAISKNVPILPGCVTPSEIQNGIKKGLTVFKFFPSELNGGVAALKLLSGPFKNVKFVPTGGIDFTNLGSYLKEKYVLACGGSYMAPAKMLTEGKFDEITALCKKAIDISLGFELAHIGINNENEAEANKVAETVSDIFRMSPKYMNSATFAGTAVEAVKRQGFGTKGHVGFFTNSVNRAMAYFKKKGVKINKESIKRNAAGEITCIYLEDEIGGFAFHIVSK